MKEWKEFIEKQEKELGQETADRWLRSLKIVSFDAGNLYLEARDSFQVMWFEEQMRDKVKKGLFSKNGRSIKVHLSSSGSDSEKPRGVKEKKTFEIPPLNLVFNSLNPRYTFDRLITHQDNQVTYKLFEELMQGKLALGTFNPIYLFGDSGSGKSHLLTAAAHELKKMNLVVIYARADTFTEHVVAAIRSGKMEEFRSAYRKCDVLIIDDVQLLAKRAATQEELFHTFNTLHAKGKQIILGADVSPRELEEIEPRLVSRFEWGISLQIKKLPREALPQLLLHHSKEYDFPLTDEISHFLIQTFSDTKSLTLALEALILRKHMQKDRGLLTLEGVEKILGDFIAEQTRRALDSNKIIHAVAEIYGVKTDDILGKSQSHDCALPRQVAMYLCRKELHIPFMKIGSLFSRDHSTVMSSVKQIDKRIEAQDKDLWASLSEIKTRLQKD